jgi:hypothetical protein
LPPPAAFDELLRRFFASPEMTIRSIGSGFIIDPDGYIVTEDHIVDNAETVTATVQEKKRYSARIIGRDAKTDLALLKINVDHPLPYVVWGDSDTARVDDWVVAIGNLLASTPVSAAASLYPQPTACNLTTCFQFPATGSRGLAKRGAPDVASGNAITLSAIGNLVPLRH